MKKEIQRCDCETVENCVFFGRRVPPYKPFVCTNFSSAVDHSMTDIPEFCPLDIKIKKYKDNSNA